jgi:uncharacterized membrane protein
VERGFVVSAKMTSLEIFDMHFIQICVSINIRTNLLMKITLHSYVCTQLSHSWGQPIKGIQTHIGGRDIMQSTAEHIVDTPMKIYQNCDWPAPGSGAAVLGCTGQYYSRTGLYWAVVQP